MRNDQQALAEIYTRIITESNGNKVIKGDVYLLRMHLNELPDWLADVDEVTGNFLCGNNRLKTLKGSPKKVKGAFDCEQNQLVSLEGAPTTVGGSFYCSKNKLTTLVGGPTATYSYYCSNNRFGI